MLHIDPNKTIYYTTLSDRVVEPRTGKIDLPPNYRWIRRGKSFKAIRRVMLWAARFTAFVYCKAVLRVKVENKDLLKKMRSRRCYRLRPLQRIDGIINPDTICFNNL